MNCAHAKNKTACVVQDAAGLRNSKAIACAHCAKNAKACSIAGPLEVDEKIEKGKRGKKGGSDSSASVRFERLTEQYLHAELGELRYQSDTLQELAQAARQANKVREAKLKKVEQHDFIYKCVAKAMEAMIDRGERMEALFTKMEAHLGALAAREARPQVSREVSASTQQESDEEET